MRTRINFVILAAWLVHAAAWFLPVEYDSVHLPYGLPGWQAFRAASSGIVPYGVFSVGSWDIWAVLATVSAATTVLFVFGSPWVVLRGSRRVLRACTWIAVAAFTINAHWLIADLSLRIGYFLWWFSFVILALGLFRAKQYASTAGRPQALEMPESKRSSTRTDGRPHAMPVWGFYIDGAVFFGTGRETLKAKNMATNPNIVVHLESGDDAAILECTVAEQPLTDPEFRKRINAISRKKYKMPLMEVPESTLYRARPKIVLAWREKDFPVSATRWVLD